MRILAIFFFLLPISNIVTGNEIDQLKTVAEVQKFLMTKVNKKWNEESIIAYAGSEEDTFGKGKFFKLDLNNDSLTDIVIDGRYLLAVVDSGNGRYGIFPIDRGAFTSNKYTLTNIINKDRIPLLVVRSYNEFTFATNDIADTDTLVFKFGNFIEYNRNPDNLKIDRIKFSAMGCYGSCPVFELSIDRNRKGSYNAKKYNSKDGNFHAVIAEVEYNRLVATINYIRLPKLNDNYRVNWTDDRTVKIEITYNNGKVKSISDYGAIGTFGLQNLYAQFHSLRNTQKWR